MALTLQGALRASWANVTQVQPVSRRRLATTMRTNVKTSEDSPIRVDHLPLEHPGRVGLTFAPGKHQRSKDGFRWARDLDADLDRLVHEYGAKLLVCLLQDHELEGLRIGGLVEAAEARGLEVARLPIPDGGVLPTRSPVVALVDRILEAAANGDDVVIHCAGGLGRAGTIGGCVLVDSGRTAAEAIEILHRVRSPRSPETRGQERFIAEYARARRVTGAVLGGAIGDAMGHPTEFMSMDAIRGRYGADGVTGYELWWERDGARFAPYTDDTQMAEAVARALLDGLGSGADLDETMRGMAERFVEWSRSPQGGHRGPGNACMSGCRALESGAHWSTAGGETAGGCGSVMRVYPFGVLFGADLERAEAWAVAHSKLTHRDPIALAASAAMTIGVAMALDGAAVDAIADAMILAARRHSPRTADMMAQAVDEAGAGVGPEVTLDRLRGWAAHEAIAATVYIFVRHPRDATAAILEGANTPGDSDSLASLAGTLVGAYGGVARLPGSWVRDVERCAELVELAEAMVSASAPTP